MFYSNFTYKNNNEPVEKEDEKIEEKVSVAAEEPSAAAQAPQDMIMPETLESTLFIPGYLNTQIGKYMRVEFLVGNGLTDRNGKLVKVGASYIILQAQNGDLIVCDLFSIKFATIIESPTVI